MEKIKILYLITGLTPGGAELTLKNIIQNLDKNKYNLSVCSITNTRDILNLIKPQINNLYFLDIKNIFNSIKGLIKLRKIIKYEKPQILHCFMFHSNILGRIASIGYRIKVISSIRTKLINNRFGNFLDRITQKLSDIYLVNSNTLQKFIHKYGINNKKIKIIENGVNFKKFKASKNHNNLKSKLGLSDKPIITMIANFKKQKDYPTIIRALVYLQKDIDFKFLVVGTGLKFEDETNKILSLINTLDLKNVKLLGFRDDIPDILAITDIWVSSTLFEGQSNSLLEAMFMKKPIVTTDIAENAEVVRHCKEALLVPIRSPKKIAQAIKKLLKDKTLSKTLAENAYKRVQEKYDINISMNKIEGLYCSLID